MYQIDLARVCHEAHRAYCLARGDLSIPSWETLAEWQRENVIVGVMVAYNNPALTPEELHEAWMAEKVAAGWTVGPVKAPDLKQHPCLIDFDDLKPEDQAKDELFIAIVRALAPVTRPQVLPRDEVFQPVAQPGTVPVVEPPPKPEEQ